MAINTHGQKDSQPASTMNHWPIAK
jgi:hypothetical protein